MAWYVSVVDMQVLEWVAYCVAQSSWQVYVGVAAYAGNKATMKHPDH